MTHPDRAALLMEVIPRMMRLIRTEFRAEQAGAPSPGCSR
jgi:hypothetical protein